MRWALRDYLWWELHAFLIRKRTDYIWKLHVRRMLQLVAIQFAYRWQVLCCKLVSVSVQPGRTAAESRISGRVWKRKDACWGWPLQPRLSWVFVVCVCARAACDRLWSTFFQLTPQVNSKLMFSRNHINRADYRQASFDQTKSRVDAMRKEYKFISIKPSCAVFAMAFVRVYGGVLEH